MGEARRYFEIPGQFALRRGGVLERPVLAYETWGKLDAARDNAVLVFTGMSPSAHAASSAADPRRGWWEEIIGPSRAIDTRRHFVICMNSLGSCFGSTGPASVDPATGEPYRLGFPLLTLEDIAVAGQRLLEHLGIARLHTLVGPSMGGMTALAHAALFPGRARQLVLVSTGARALPYAVALRSLQREMIRRDPAFADGHYDAAAGPITGMRLARKLGMLSYRSAQEWEGRFGRERIAAEQQPVGSFAPEFEVESYLEAHAQKFTGQFDPNSYLYLSRASDLFDLAEHGGSVEAALARLQVERALVIGVETDILFPIHQQRELAAGLEQAGAEVVLAELPSIQGHDAFLVDTERFGAVIGEFLAGGRTTRLRPLLVRMEEQGASRRPDPGRQPWAGLHEGAGGQGGGGPAGEPLLACRGR
ncbi:MAG: homoserine O-acetyltransferase [Gammaproteobacteria bacterium]|nr:homoserine O-acetyltransferase [Gammaproteobacteria bacterium]